MVNEEIKSLIKNYCLFKYEVAEAMEISKCTEIIARRIVEKN